MPLKGYIGKSDPSRISSVSPAGPDRRKKILPITKFSKEMYVRIYVLDCVTHEPGGVVIPVELVHNQPGVGWESLGWAKCCPLCWKILQFPVGYNPPKITKLLVPKPRTERQVAALKKGRTQSGRKGFRPITEERLERIRDMLLGDNISVYDVMEQFDVVRSQARKYLEYLVKVGYAVADREGLGRGKQTLYKKAP